MSQLTKKHILISLDRELEAQVIEIVSTEGDSHLEIHTSKDSTLTYNIVFTDDVNYKRVEGQEVVVVGDDLSSCEFSVIPSGLLSFEFIRAALRRLVGIEGSLNIESQVSDEDYRSLKITDPLSIGHYLDIAMNEAYRLSSDYINIGRAFSEVSTIFFRDFKSLNIEVDLICNEEFFILQFHSVARLDSQLIKETSRALKSLTVNLSDIYTLSQTSETVISLVWHTEQSLNAHLCHGLESFSRSGPTSEVYKKLDRIIDPRLHREDFLNKNATDEKISSLSTIKKVTDYVRGIKNKEPENFDFESALKSYPNQESIDVLNGEDIEFIRKIIEDAKAYKTITDTISGHRESLGSNKEVTKLIPRAVEELEAYEALSAFEDEDEAITKILGVTQDLSEENTLVKGSAEDDAATTIIEGVTDELREEILRIKGSKEDLEELWKSKRTTIAKSLKQEIENYVVAGDCNLEDLEDKVHTLLSEKMGLSELESKKLGNLIFSSASAMCIGEEITESNSENFFLSLELDKIKGQLSKKDEQIIRLRRVMDKMKADFLSRKQADDELKNAIGKEEDANAQSQLKLSELKVRSLLRDSKIKDGKIRETEKKFNHTIKNRNHRIELLEEKINDLVATNSSLYEKLDELDNKSSFETEKAVLEGQLKAASDKIEYLNSQLEQAKASSSSVGESVSLEMFNQVKEDAKKYQEEIVSLKRDNIHLSKTNEVFKQQDEEHEPNKAKELEGLLKASNLEVKKYEQKIKFMTSQMNEMEKKLKRFAGSGAGRGSGGAAGSDKRAKQLEKNLEKVNTLKAKAESELAKKREEAHKQKTENTLLKNKIAELERKIGKKAA